MKNKIFYIALLFMMFVTMSSTNVWHKFYVSVTQIDYNEKKDRIEISSRIFIDDLEKSLNHKYKTKLNLATNVENPEAKNYIIKYLKEMLNLKVNNESLDIVFLGLEYEDDVVILYLKSNFDKKITALNFKNKILLETYEEQQNIVHTNIQQQKKSFLLTKNEDIAQIKF